MFTTPTDVPTRTKAVVHASYGGPEALEFQDIATPEVADDAVLVHVHAASLNRVDWYMLTGTPWLGRPSMGLRKPKAPELRADFAGTVEAVGRDVTDFRPGDEVFGRGTGFAEYVGAGDAIALKPSHLSFEEAAAVPLAALTALQALRDHGQLQPGQKVLINGASGGVGTFAVQIAKALGAEVTAVCSTANVELARSLGADHVIDYTRDDFTQGKTRYDLLFDNAGSKSWGACKRVLAENATVVLVGGSKKNRLLGPLGHILGMKLGALRGSRKAAFFIANLNRADLEAVAELLEAGTIRAVIDRRYVLSEISDAFRYLGEGHTRGKIVIAI
jgi:NADPH:quinone reductase-like Zn-dependent oxidoreductase